MDGYEEQTPELEEIEGTVEIVTFRNDQNGYTVLQLNTDYELLTVVGNFPSVLAGDILRLRGTFETHKIYGQQFHAQMSEQIRPATAEAILKYLSSGAIRGIGPATAARMVERFGENTLDILETQPERLSQIKGISLAKAVKIGQEYKKMFGMRDVMLRFVSMGISTEESLRIYKSFGTSSVEKITENPYNLCSEDIGFSFERADSIAAGLGIAADHTYRVRSGLLYVLRHNLANGHTCLPREKLIDITAQLLSVSRDAADIACDQLAEEDQVALHRQEEREFVSLKVIYEAERYIAGRLKTMLDYPPAPITALENQINAIELANGIQYEKRQREAIIAALSKGLLIMTGGPGTGKTTTLKAIITILEQQGLEFALAAPTGRAAQRMSDLTGYEAKTLHRLLEAERGSDGRLVFVKNERNPLSAQAIIVDELSMVDTLLFEALLRASRLGCRLIMVGDCNQLPAVGAGNVLGDLIDSGRLPVICLNTIFRQAMQSHIVTNAHLIVAGKPPEFSKKEGDFFLVKQANPMRAARIVNELCTVRLPRAYGFDPLEDIQVLCPSRKGETGTASLNRLLAERLNPPVPGRSEYRNQRTVLREGDKVMQMRNNYEIVWTRNDGKQGCGVFNGDIGVLQSADRATGILSVKFDDKLALYSAEDADDLEQAYAITIHKSQGSEYTCVVIPVVGAPPQLMFRNLLYTGVTRAKRLLVLVGTETAVAQMVDNDRKTLRYTALNALLD